MPARDLFGGLFLLSIFGERGKWSHFGHRIPDN